MAQTPARRIAPAFWLFAAVVLSGIMIGAAWLLGPWLDSVSKPVATALVVVPILGGDVLGCLHWRGLDEPAREAHKSAWFWGGSMGLALGAMGLVVMMLFPTAGDALAGYVEASRGRIHPATFAATMGFFACCMAQILFYALAWGRWWLKRRG